MTGATAFGAVAMAPAALADDSVAVQPAAPDAVATAPAATDPAVTPPPVVYDKNGKPIKEPKVCKAKDFEEAAKKVAEATKKAAPQLAMAAKSHAAADLLRAQEVTLTPAQAKVAEVVANGLDMVGDRIAAQAQAAINKAGTLECLVVSAPGGRC